ncbi:hypothetical protein F4813DRAFT_353055 [Daldinia decipiens]|uniref:uncharacterized protein n=1 Tax=Daldinia decipiens TaxID=326647 RepID=UPI0020C59A77|nr:uncharacterized protein F4813DRAFT_353055 [Daldinia decipiens]KAI1659463.1 hypothetical protein F4813DRAFT_353055 [Daldinia decipiens]
MYVGSQSHFPYASAIGALTCVDSTCYKTFGTNEQLRKHGEKEGHNAYGCICGTTFTRLDALNRHISSKSRNAAQYLCEYCYAYQGENAFSRRDHLTQHLKVYHRIDTADKLGQHKLRRSKKATVAPGPQASMPLMPPYPCPVLGCPKMGYDGYLRNVDLDEHVVMMHPSTLMYPYNTQEHAFDQQYQVPMQPDQQNIGSGSI